MFFQLFISKLAEHLFRANLLYLDQEIWKHAGRYEVKLNIGK